MFSIQVLDANKNPVKYKKVKIETSFTSQSGGHQHTNGTIELPPGLKQGWFYGQGQYKINPLILTTDVHGVADVELFIASEFSGQYLVTASLVSDASVKDTVNLQVKVPGLMNFEKYATSELLWTFEQKDKEIGKTIQARTGFVLKYVILFLWQPLSGMIGVHKKDILRMPYLVLTT